MRNASCTPSELRATMPRKTRKKASVEATNVAAITDATVDCAMTTPMMIPVRLTAHRAP